MKLKNIFLKTVLAASIGSIVAGCSSDNNSADNRFDENDPLYLVKSTSWSTDDGISLVYLTDSLDSETVFDSEQAMATAGYHFVSINESHDNPDTAFHMAVDNTPKLERYIVDETGNISLDKTLDFTNQGITDSRNSMRSAKIFSAEKGVIIDSATMQVIIFNPTEMTVTQTISLSEYEEADYPRRWSIFPVIDGNRVVVPITFYEADWTPAALSKLVVVDTETDTVTVDSSTQCGSVSASAVDADGNIYFAASSDIAVTHHLDPNNTFAPCMIRMKSGENTWDDDYYVDLSTISEEGRPTFGIMTGEGNTAYTLIYSDEADPITPENADTITRGAVWEFHSLTLGDEAGSLTKLDNVEPTVHRVQFGSFEDGSSGLASWMMRINDDWTESTVYDTTDSTSWEVRTTIPGALETIGRLR